MSGEGKHAVMNDPVFQGLAKKRKCALCEQIFIVPELPGRISYKSVLDLRQKWGVDVRKNGRMLAPSFLYQEALLCVFCSQFFESGFQEQAAASGEIAEGTARSSGSPLRASMSRGRSSSPTKRASGSLSMSQSLRS